MIMEFWLSLKPETRSENRKTLSILGNLSVECRWLCKIGAAVASGVQWFSGSVSGFTFQLGHLKDWTFTVENTSRYGHYQQPSGCLGNCGICDLPSIIHVICIKSGSLQFVGETVVPPIGMWSDEAVIITNAIWQKIKIRFRVGEWIGSIDHYHHYTELCCRSSIFICCRW